LLRKADVLADLRQMPSSAPPYEEANGRSNQRAKQRNARAEAIHQRRLERVVARGERADEEQHWLDRHADPHAFGPHPKKDDAVDGERRRGVQIIQGGGDVLAHGGLLGRMSAFQNAERLRRHRSIKEAVTLAPCDDICALALSRHLRRSALLPPPASEPSAE